MSDTDTTKLPEITIEMPDFIQTERIKIPYAKFVMHPHYAIKELLGQNITIVDYNVNDIITNDDCHIIDVRYKSIKFSPYAIYYIPVDKIKRIIPDSNTYGFALNGCNVMLTSSQLGDYAKTIPLKIYAKSVDNHSVNGQLDVLFPYFATPAKNPLNKFMTPIKYPNYNCLPFEVEPEPKQYPDSYKPILKSIDETLAAYKSDLQRFPLFKHIDNIAKANEFKDCAIYTPTTTAYLIDFNKIPLDKDLNGVIAITDNRHPDFVLYFPTFSFILTTEELRSLKSFMESEKVRYYNYHYIMSMNKK